MSNVRSNDGTTIAYDRAGSGPPVILVDGALCHRGMGPMPALARLLAPRFTVFTYDRRGRGASGNTMPWSVEREIDDIAALIAEAGGTASLVGISSGAALVLDAAARQGLPARHGLAREITIERLAVYEPPFIVDDTRSPVPDDFIAGLDRQLAEGNRGEVIRRFMRIVGAPGLVVAVMRLLPGWKRLAAVAHTVPWDLSIMRGTQSGKPLPDDRWAPIAIPILVMDGGKSPAWMRNGCSSLADLLTRSSYRTLPGQTHMVKPDVLAPALIEFLASGEPAAVAPAVVK